MGNFFKDVAGGFLGMGPGTETMSGYEFLPTEKKQGLDRLRAFLDTGGDPAQGGQRFAGGFGSFFAPYYQALPEEDRTRRVDELKGAYDFRFNPLLNDIYTRAEGELSKSGLLNSGRAAAVKTEMGRKLALESALPVVQYKHELEDVNRAETLRNRLHILNLALGVNYPGQVEVAKPTSMERAYGNYLGKGVDTVAKFFTFGQGSTMPAPTNVGSNGAVFGFGDMTPPSSGVPFKPTGW